MRICVLFTGGTIGSAAHNGIISPDKSDRFKLLSMYKSMNRKINQGINNNLKDEIIWDCSEVYQILSENLNGKYLSLLIDAVSKALDKNMYDGIIVTHGTDTLQFTSAMLEYVFSNVSIPIILVSSDYCLEDERANGLINFDYAVKYILGGYKAGVYVSYCNKGGVPTLHRGTCLQNPLSYSADVLSIKDIVWGRFEGEDFIYNKNVDWKQVNDRISRVQASLSHINTGLNLADAESKIMTLRAVPGMYYPCFNDSSMSFVKYVIIEAYHSGTICVDDSLKSFVTKAQTFGITVYLVGLADTEAEYETVEEYIRLGIIPAMDESFVSLFCRCWLESACKDAEKIKY